MPNYRRTKTKGGTYFFTVVTYRRQKILTLPESRRVLRNAIVDVKKRLPFSIAAWVLLPDHIHCLWTLPRNDSDFSKRWGLIKAKFTKQAKDLLHRYEWMNDSKRMRRESTIWQRRFWEHRIRDEGDSAMHMDYIHYNPVKHGHATAPKNWRWSSFRRYVNSGDYSENWGNSEEQPPDFGDIDEDLLE